jgi:16S rRNA (uracil1498-N3)-methyltransferase
MSLAVSFIVHSRLLALVFRPARLKQSAADGRCERGGKAVDAQRPKIRLFVDCPLAPGGELGLSGDRAHYLLDVMRLRTGDAILVFNGRDGEWQATLAEGGRRDCRLIVCSCVRAQFREPGPWLLQALVKRSATDLIVGKATELGVERIVFLPTLYANASPPNPTRLHAIAIEAAEQCGRLTIPGIASAAGMAQALANWPADRQLWVMHPYGVSRTVALADAGNRPQASPPGLLIGPEGGLAPSELDELMMLPFVLVVSLGPLVLRAETAAISALACWQALVARRAGATPPTPGVT